MDIKKIKEELSKFPPKNTETQIKYIWKEAQKELLEKLYKDRYIRQAEYDILKDSLN